MDTTSCIFQRQAVCSSDARVQRADNKSQRSTVQPLCPRAERRTASSPRGSTDLYVFPQLCAPEVVVSVRLRMRQSTRSAFAPARALVPGSGIKRLPLSWTDLKTCRAGRLFLFQVGTCTLAPMKVGLASTRAHYSRKEPKHAAHLWEWPWCFNEGPNQRSSLEIMSCRSCKLRHKRVIWANSVLSSIGC